MHKIIFMANKNWHQMYNISKRTNHQRHNMSKRAKNHTKHNHYTNFKKILPYIWKLKFRANIVNINNNSVYQ